MLAGYATPHGTARYRDRFPQLRDAYHFRCAEHVPDAGDLSLSSIGLGTYLGEPDDAADQAYTHAIVAALRAGVNVLDTAINYRHQRSERNIGAALKQLDGSGELKRDEVLICTKAGYLSLDGSLPADPREYFMQEYIEPGILDPEQLVGGMHCIAPAYLENQIERSRTNLALETIDLFYLHNPEAQLASISREVFYQRLREAFAMLEETIKVGRLRYYGMATWNAFRVTENAHDYISLFDVVDLAHEVAGEQHHFRFVQVPYNLAMPEAYGLPNQWVGKNQQKTSLLTTASRLGILVMGSATLSQGRLAHGLPDFVSQALGLKSDAENAIQFSRSTPGVTTSLIGMGQKQHVAANLKVAAVPPAPKERWSKLLNQR